MFGTIDIALVVLYLAFMLGIGVYTLKYAKSVEDYLVAGRRLVLFTYIPAMAAVVLGGASTIGTGKLGYTFGISGVWFLIMLSLGVIANGLIVAPKIIPLKIKTMGEFLEKRYDRSTRIIGSVVVAIYDLMVAVTQTIAIGTVFSAMLGWDPAFSMIIGGLVVLLYTALGGMWSVTLTDIIQFWIMTIGVSILVPVFGFMTMQSQGLSLSQLPSSFFDWGAVGGDTILLWFMLYFFGLMLGQDIWGRVLTAKNKKVGTIGTVAAGLYGIVYAFAAVFGGMVAYLLFSGGLENPQYALPSFVAAVYPTGLGGLVLAGMLAAFMSTGDSCLLAATSLIVYDVIGSLKKFSERTMLMLLRIFNVLFGIFMIVAAVAISEVLVALDIAYLYLSAGLFIPIVVGLYWRRPSSIAAKLSILTSILVATAVALYIGWPYGFAELEPMLYGLITSVIVYLIVSFIRPSKEVTTEGEKG